MRRLLSITLIALLGLPSLVALVAVSDESNLPACCRRAGAHHCAMSAAMLAQLAEYESRTPGFSAPSRCANYPSHASAATAPRFALAWTQARIPAIFQVHTVIPYRASAASRALPAADSRGPPSHMVG